MPISRRGFTAAGLALAAVAAVGVTSTLEAGAAQVAEPRLPATSVPALSDLSASDDTPPPPLTGADEPTASAAAAAKVARFSARQADTARVSGPRPNAARADAPPPPTSVDAPKGLPPLAAAGAAKPATALRSGIPPTTSSAAAPPAPLAAARAPSPTVKYFYATGEFNAVAANRAAVDGATAMMTIGKPALHSRDSHSLAEIAVRSVNEKGEPDGRQVVEVGWTVDRQVNTKNPTEPHLFVYRWVNGDPTDGKGNHCYNSSECGFVRHSSATIAPGDKLTAGETKKFGIQHFGNSWWIWYDKGWIGRYPDSVWGDTFTKVGHVQWFGEVAAGGATPCSEMGKGRSARSSGAARFYAIKLLTNGLPNTESTPTDVSVGTWPLGLTYYDIYKPPPPPTPSTPPSPPEDEPKPVNHFFYGGKGGDCS